MKILKVLAIFSYAILLMFQTVLGFQDSNKQAPDDRPSDVTTTPPKIVVSKQYYDGIVYLYGTDCCVDGHQGLFYSSNLLQTKLCGSPGGQTEVPDDATATDIDLPVFSVNRQDNTVGLRLYVDNAFRNAKSPAFYPELNNIGNPFRISDHYGDDNIFATSVKLQDQVGGERFFNLARCRLKGQSSKSSPFLKSFDQTFLLLYRSRSQNSFTIRIGQPPFYRDQIFMPTTEIVVDQPLSDRNWYNNFIDLVTIQLPSPVTGQLVDHTCMIIHTKD